MTRHLRRLILAVTIVISSTIASYAQTSIDKIVTKLEDNPKCETTTYRETRDPNTHKITNIQMVVKFSDNAIAERLISAFKSERKNAISYTVNNNGKNSRTHKLYRIIFHNNDGSYSDYTLTSSLHAKKRSSTSKGSESTSEDVWTLLVKSSNKTAESNKSGRQKKTSIKRSKTIRQHGTPAVVLEDLDIDIDIDFDPDFPGNIVDTSVQSSINIPASSDFRY